jgi:thiol-disulfide isomerase/thioredoxin
MKNTVLILMLNILAMVGLAQDNHPVSWKLSSEKTSDLTYKVMIEATVASPYHIYPQQSSGGMGMPTEFLFADDENIELLGDVQEKGSETKSGQKVAYYAKSVVFTQNIKLKSERKTELAFTVKYMACTDQFCLAPSKKQFTLAVNGGSQTASRPTISATPGREADRVLAIEDFTLADTAKKMISSKDITLKSKYTFIDFWASWCIPCRAQGRELISIYNIYKPKGFSVIGVSLDTNHENWKKAIKADKYTWTNVSDLKGFDSAMIINYGITAIPRNFLIDNKGNIIAQDLHGEELDTKLAELFEN